MSALLAARGFIWNIAIMQPPSAAAALTAPARKEAAAGSAGNLPTAPART
jgi:hypothetical protein